MPLKGPPPPFALHHLTCRAHIDFLTVFCEVKVPIPSLDGKANWVKDPRDKTSFNLTIHDPTRLDVVKVAGALENPLLMRLELAVDFMPRPGIPAAAREDLLRSTFHSVAGRFRPEDATDWGYGLRGAVTGAGQKPEPFHTRYPDLGAQLIYGHRTDFMQSKAYLKRIDQHAPLPPDRHLVRTELAIARVGLMDSGLDRVLDLCTYPYRRVFAKHFRLIDRPEVRARNERCPSEVTKLEGKMNRAWGRAGVGKFAPDLVLPPETSTSAVQRIHARAHQQLARDDYVLKRDVAANRKVGTALRLLEKRMA